jgi:hypothetical protein
LLAPLFNLFCFGLTEPANKKIKFEDLKYNQFVAGEMEIIIACKNDKEKTGRFIYLLLTI